ncbi:hypothetical protein P7C70_g6983, partial [Phenoliferia sp. Uapishka_3]
MQRLKGMTLPSLPSLPFSTSTDHSTPPPLSEDRFSQLTLRKSTLSSLLTAFSSFHKTASKQRSNPHGGGQDAIPLHWLAEEFRIAGEQLRDDRSASGYGRALSKVGTAHQELAELTTTYIDSLSHYKDQLEQRVSDYKEFDKRYKDAEKARSTLESIIIKAEKSKKGRSEFEDDIEQAELSYQDECELVERKADALDAGMEKESKALQDLLDAELGKPLFLSLISSIRPHELFNAAFLFVPQSFVRTLLHHHTSSPPAHPTLSLLPSALRMTKPSAPHTRATSLAVPKVATRMSRSYSDSSVMQEVASSAASNTGPRSGSGLRRTTITSSFSDSREKEKSDGSGNGSGKETPKSRSRSGSMLSRFTGGGKKEKEKEKEKKARGRESSAAASRGSDEEEELADDPNDLEADNDSYRSASPPPNFSSNLSMPTMPTLNSLKKLGSASPKYNSLDDDYSSSPLNTSYSSPPSSSSHSKTLRGSASSPTIRQPSFIRTQTAPTMRPRPSSIDTFIAKWAFKGDPTDSSELPLEKNDVVRVERHVNAEWWIGTIIEGAGRGRKGMFPAAFVVPVEVEAEQVEDDERSIHTNGSESGDGVSFSGFVPPKRIGGSRSSSPGTKMPARRGGGGFEEEHSPFAD